MRIAVIGGTGHIGSYLTPRLVEAGHQVVCVSRRRKQPYQLSGAWERIEYCVLDRDVEEAAGTFGRRVAELGAEAVVDLTCYRPESARQMVEALRGRVGHFLHCGTIWVHGVSIEVPTREDQPREPFGDYGIRKAAIERYLLEEARGHRFPATILHPGHLVGPGWNPINPAGNFNPGVFSSLASGREVALPNLGMETLHHVHCFDVAAAFAAALDRPAASIGESFHVVSDAALTLRGYAMRMSQWFGKEASLHFLPWDEWSATVSEKDAQITLAHVLHSSHCSNAKARRQLGWKPRYTSLAAVQEAVEWLVSQGTVVRG